MKSNLKANKDEISKWQFDINEWFLSLNYTVKGKDLSGKQQLIYENENHKYTFVYYATGRITIKGYDNIDKLRCVFLDKIDRILGTTIYEIECDMKSQLAIDTVTKYFNKSI